MFFSIGLFCSACILYLVHFLLKLATFDHMREVFSLLMGIALVGMILSGACFFMNVGNKQLKKKKKYYFWIVLSIVCFALFLGYIVLCLIERAREVGITF